MVGTVQSHMPIAPFMISIVISSMLFGWLFAHTQRSVLPAIALHMSVNAWTAIFVGPVDDTVTPFAPLTTLIVATAVLLFVRAGSGPEPGGGPS